MAPLRFFVDGVVGNFTKSGDHCAVRADSSGGELSSRRLVHERHEFVRKTRHRARDADAADIRASADAAHPSAFGHVAIDNRSPAADLHQAFRFAVLVREAALLVVAPAIAAFMYSLSKKPGGPQFVVERNHWRH